MTVSIPIPAFACGMFLCVNDPNVCRGTGISMSHTPTSCGPVYFGSVREISAPNGERRGTSCSFGGSALSARTCVVVDRGSVDERRRGGGGGLSRRGEAKSGFEEDVNGWLLIVVDGVG